MISMALFDEITDAGFQYEMSADVFDKINEICVKMNLEPMKSRIYQKITKPPVVVAAAAVVHHNHQQSKHDKKKRNVREEIPTTTAAWDKLWSYKTTKLEKKQGIEEEIDQVRSILNKLSEKTFFDTREKLIGKLDIFSEQEEEQQHTIGTAIYDLMSCNRLNSSICAGLFAELVTRYNWLHRLFMEKYTSIMDMYLTIEYVDADKDYDGFCEMNKKNDKRKAITLFYHHLTTCGLLKNEETLSMQSHLLDMITRMIIIPNKKNEVDELTENVALLFDKNVMVDKATKGNVMAVNVIKRVDELAKCKAKDYVSLSNKAIFKFMDMNE